MTEAEAIKLLKYHSGSHEDIAHVKSVKSFLGMLRPFNGQLYRESFDEVMEILKALGPRFGGSCIEKDFLSDLWAICYYARVWGMDKDGMLRRNNLISDQQVELLSTWVNEISFAVMMLLEETGGARYPEDL